MGEAETVHAAFAEWAAGLASRTGRSFFSDQLRANASFRAERDNLASAMSWALEHDRPDLAARIFSGLAHHWFFDARHDGELWVAPLLERLDDLEPGLRGEVLFAAGLVRCDDPTLAEPVAWLADPDLALWSVVAVDV